MIKYNNKGVMLHDLFRFRGSVIPRALLIALPSAFLGMAISLLHGTGASPVDEDIKAHFASSSLKSSQLWSAMSAALAFMIFFRTNKAYGRFWDGTTLLHQMWGEWFDTVSCLIAFSHTARTTKPLEVNNFRHTLIRLMSLCHAAALEEVAQSEAAPTGYPCIDLGGLDQSTLKYIKACKHNKKLNFNRVEVLIHMIQNLIVVNHENGALKIPPPVLSRVFQTLSRGQVNLMNCKKIVHTLFPFPYAQIISWLILAFAITTPFVMASLIEESHWVFVFTLLPVFGLVSLNYIAVEIEMPFGDDPNDLPLETFQAHMNKSMLMLISDQSDICPHLSEFYARDFDTMQANISTKRPRHFIDSQRKTQGLPPDDDELVVPEFPMSAMVKSCENGQAGLLMSPLASPRQNGQPGLLFLKDRANTVEATTKVNGEASLEFFEPKVAPPKLTEPSPPPSVQLSPRLQKDPPLLWLSSPRNEKLKDSTENPLPALSGKLEDLIRSCDELVTSTTKLSSQMKYSTDVFKELSMSLKEGTLSRI